MKRLMVAYSSTIEVKTPRLSGSRMCRTNHPSTARWPRNRGRVKWKVNRGCRVSHAVALRLLAGGIAVEDHMDRLVSRDLALGPEKADEFLVPVAPHAAPDDLTVQHIGAPRFREGRLLRL